MEINKTEVGKRISIIRKSLGKNMDEFGELVSGASKSNVSKWENGVSLPSNERLKIIAEIGNTTVENLLHGEQITLEKLYENANPKEVGKIVKYARLYWDNDLFDFSKLINMSLKLCNHAELISEQKLKEIEKGITLPTLEQCGVIAGLINVPTETFLRGEIGANYNYQVAKNMLLKIGYQAEDKILSDVINALNQTEILRVQIADIAQMYANNLDNPTVYIKDTNSLIDYLKNKQTILESIVESDSMPEEMQMDFGIEIANISQEIKKIYAYKEILKPDL
ncbi:helix-turn-helix domain-containing protein [Vagococcus humatus]|uniref:HTH cro/C1-type domain-containing protein n=1 Tax=Vagococcus humatus TaxID=1889241 RepID=A0A429Z5Y3_9ENTE|nr:helix-turn-helix transcriptional regulator [Vagococcus humatus]RST89106.1 hypothetical protein C7P63_07405 [Vagococcus humatus]